MEQTFLQKIKDNWVDFKLWVQTKWVTFYVWIHELSYKIRF